MKAQYEVVAMLAIAGLVACAPVKIVAPDDSRKTVAIPDITLKFENDYQPGTFRATLNGNDVTAPVFGACGATTGNCTVAAPAFPQSENVLKVHGEFTRSRAFGTCCSSRTIRPAEIRFSLDALGSCYSPPRVGGGVASGGTGSSGGSSGSASGGTVRLPADQCTPSFRMIVNDSQTKTIHVLLPAAPSNPAGQTITIVPASTSVSLNNAAAGASITVNVPANDRRTAFSVRGINASGGNFAITGSAPGYATAHGTLCTRSPPNSTVGC